MLRKLLLAAMVAATVLPFVIGAPASATEQEAHKWYVCKYVGPPGSGEVLQTGDNPIFVDENSIDVEEVFIGATFSDKQSHSLIVAGPFFSALEVEPTCPGETPPPGVASATLSTPTCTDLFIRLIGSNLTDHDVTFDVFINGTLIDAFVIGAGLQATGPGLVITDGDVITVTLEGSDVVLATRTIDLNCTTPPPPPPPGQPCPGEIAVGSWYGDPRVNIDLTGEGTFVVWGGIQRFTGLRRITKMLACDETFRVNRYKVRHGHFLNISMDGVRIVHVKPPRVR